MWSRGNKLALRRTGRALLLRAAGLLPLLALPVLAGCPPAHQQHIQQGGDPLLGQEFRKGAAPINPTTTQTRSPGPTTAPVDNSMSNAALAIGVLPDSQPLGMPVADGPAGRKAGPNQSGWTVPGANNPVQPVLRKPVPIEPQSRADQPRINDPQVVPAVMAADNAGAPTAVPAVTPPAMTAADWEQQLKKRGVVDVRQEQVPEGVRLIGFVPNPQNPNALRVYQATAADPATAAQAILQRLGG
jgi:hypothetical protein